MTTAREQDSSHAGAASLAAVAGLWTALPGRNRPPSPDQPGVRGRGGWSRGWTIENRRTTARRTSITSHRPAADTGGLPRSGAHAIEIYSSDPCDELSQPVTLEPGTYRLAVWARNNGASHTAATAVSLGEKSVLVPVLADR